MLHALWNPVRYLSLSMLSLGSLFAIVGSVAVALLLSVAFSPISFILKEGLVDYFGPILTTTTILVYAYYLCETLFDATYLPS